MIRTSISRFLFSFSALIVLGFVSTVQAGLVFVNESDGIHDPVFYIDSGDTSTDFIDLEFGTTLDAKLRFDIVNDKFSLNRNVDVGGNELLDARLENAGVAPTCDAASLGRTYYDTTADSAYVCEESAPATYTWIDLTVADTTSSSKIVTAGTGGNYANISGAAAYLGPLSGGIILLTPETHAVTTVVDLENIRLIGSNPEQSIVQVTGAGSLQVKDSAFENLTIDVPIGLVAATAMDVKYNASATSSLVFNWADISVATGKNLIGSTAGTAPTMIARFFSPSAKSGDSSVLPTKVLSGLNTALSAVTFEGQGGDGALSVNDWDVLVSGASEVITSGAITTVPENTIYVYPSMNLQGALDSITTGGSITLLPGTHTISQPLLVSSDSLQIKGYGDASVIEASGFVGIGTTTAAIQIGAADGTAPVSDISLSDFRLEVNNSAIHGIRAAGGIDINVSNVTVEKTAGTSLNGTNAKIGILLMDGSATPLVRPVIRGSRVLGGVGRWFTDGIHVSGEGAVGGLFGNGNGVTNALVESSSVDYVGETAAAFVHVTDSSLFNNRFANMGGSGGSAYGLYMGRINRVSMTNNIISGSLSATSLAIGLESFNIGADPTTQNSTFSGNIIDGFANGGVGFGTGFQIGATAGTTVKNNVFQQNSILGASAGTTTAVLFRGDADQNFFANNIVSGGTNAWDTGINFLNATADRNVMRGAIFDNVTTKISDSGTDTKNGVTHHRDTVDPTVNNDTDEGYTVGTLWINTTADTSFVSVDDSAGAAVWNQVDAAGGGHTQNTDTGTDSNSFTLDNDDTGGDVSLVFGTTLNESLFWDDANDRFALSDDLRVEGNFANVGASFIAGDHAAADSDGSISLGRNGSTWETLIFDATTDDQFELSDDLAIGGSLDFTGTLGLGGDTGTAGQILTSNGAGAPTWETPGSVFYAYDTTGDQLVTAVEATLNIDTSVISDANYALALDQVTVTAAGVYKITLEAGFREANTTGGARTSVTMKLQEGGADIPGALADCYLRESEENTCSLTIIENVGAGGVIRARLQRSGGTTVAETLPDASRLLIERIR